MNTKKILTSLAALLVPVMMVAGSASAAGAMKYEVVDNSSIPKSLTGTPGDAAKGKKTAISRKKGNCLACHKMPIPEQSFHGEVGPDLAGVASRYNEGELRLRLVDSKILNESTIMPAFYMSEGFHRPLKKFVGKSILNAAEIEDVLAYLLTLKE